MQRCIIKAIFRLKMPAIHAEHVLFEGGGGDMEEPEGGVFNIGPTVSA